jgi:precorrin-6x reductase
VGHTSVHAEQEEERARISPPPKSVGQDHAELVHCSTVVAPNGWVNGHKKEFMKRDRCAHCMTLAKAAGTAGASRPKLNGKDVPKPVMVCKVCKVNLCNKCKELWAPHGRQGDAAECDDCEE